MEDHWRDDRQPTSVQRVKVSEAVDWILLLHFDIHSRRKKSCAKSVTWKWQVIVHGVEQQRKWSVWLWYQVKATVEVKQWQPKKKSFCSSQTKNHEPTSSSSSQHTPLVWFNFLVVHDEAEASNILCMNSKIERTPKDQKPYRKLSAVEQ